jgi:hypothetical protein
MFKINLIAIMSVYGDYSLHTQAAQQYNQPNGGLYLVKPPQHI